MNIAIFADCFLPQVNGVVNATLNLSQGLAKKGHNILIFAPKYRGYKFPDLGKNIKVVTVIGLPALFYPGLKLTFPFHQKILRSLIKNKIQILHFQVPMSLALEAIFCAKLLKLPLVGTFHTFFGDSEYLKHARLDYNLVQKISWQLNRLYYNRCKLITCPSSATKKILESKKFKKPIQVISNGIDPTFFDNRKSAEIRAKYNISGPLCLFVGRVAYEKNLLFLVDCFKEVTKQVPNARLMIVGEGPQMEDLKEKITQLKLENNIILTGEIQHNTLAKSGIYGAADIFVTASKTENQSLTVLEAQVNGLPTVAVKAKGMVDSVNDKTTGILVEPDNKKAFSEAIINLLKSKETMEKYKKNTKQEVKKHYLENIIKEWEQAYSKLLKPAS